MKTNWFSSLLFFAVVAAGGVAAYLVAADSPVGGFVVGLASFVIAILFSSAVKVANQWDRALVLRLGRFHSLCGPGICPHSGRRYHFSLDRCSDDPNVVPKPRRRSPKTPCR
jgi:hypothetical protein